MMTKQDANEDRQTRNNRRETWRVWVIVALWCGLALQGAADIVIRQSGHNAFPTIAMPGFGANNIGSDGNAKITTRQVFVLMSDGDSRAVTPEALLAPMPVASAISTLDEIFEPSADVAPQIPAATIDYLKRQADALDLDRETTGIRIIWQPERFNVRSFERTLTGEATEREVTW